MGYVSEVVSPDDLPGAVEGICAKHDGDIVVHGSVQLAQELLAQGLVDELRLMVFPTVLGAGKRLFGDADSPVAMKLTETLPAGETICLVYQPKDA